ncbi:oligopeptide ABC transporter, periplasmic oligopeptide-binding protein OppA [Lentilactobacillus kosonis]|uniref:Oligopeptide ABC transporter, periplasmic oligopeptide-binding protein OppA n=1 Tax=Lentilactobacillus kosonis TaxID=2810561 RepID=A0A401FMC0_9LACO|nr:oligopeptide ABC transporter, periplasmic oligopeptide-binding protein OppA [Lentilactobacillus kosonis]
MKLSSVAKLGGAAAFAALILAGCGSNSSQSSNSKTLNWTESANLPTMDLSKATDVVSGRMTNSTGEGLLRLAADNKVIPGVAKNYEISKDGKTWTFNLRKSNWSNGKPVTAKDFVYSWQRTVNPKTASQYAYIFGNIVNANKVNTGKLPLSKLGVEAKGDYKLVVHLIKPQSFFKYMVAQSYYFPESKAAVEKYGSKYGTTSSSLVYNGPFKMTGWNGTNDSWKLVKNNQYWNKSKVKLNDVNVQVIKDPATALNSYQSGKLDFTTLNGTQVNQFKKSKEYRVNKEASTFYLEMNRQKDPIFKNANIRKALSLAIDRTQMADKVMADGSVAPKGYVPANMSKHDGKDFADTAYTKTGVSYNLAQAKKYWAKGLKETGKKSASFNLLSDDTDKAKKSN